MGLRFTKQTVRNKERQYIPCQAPVVTHVSHQGWENLGIEMYKAAFGEAAYDKYSQLDLPIPMPDESLRLRSQLWCATKKAQLLFGYKALASGRRATHMPGVGATGTVTIVKNSEFPEHEFFRPGSVFACRIRHANASFFDDASIQVRSLSIKFANTDFDSPLDIVMNSGATSAFWSLKSFMNFVYARLKTREDQWDSQREFMKLSPTAMLGTIESVRHAPSSYAEMTYYTKIVFPFKAKDKKNRYVKFRAIPVGLTKDSGLVGLEAQKQPWVQNRTPGDTRPRAYLQQEYKDRLRQGPVEYSLQIQLREFNDQSDTDEFFNLARYWDEMTYPWIDLGLLKLTDPLEDKVTERTRMWLGHQPPSLGVTDANSEVDYRSLAWARVKVYPVSQCLRAPRRRLNMQRRLKNDF